MLIIMHGANICIIKVIIIKLSTFCITVMRMFPLHYCDNWESHVLNFMKGLQTMT